MKRTIIVLSSLLIIVMVITGCWNRRELNELAIGVAIGVDKRKDSYVLYVQVVNPGVIAQKGGGGGPMYTPVTTYEMTGKSIFEAFRRMTTIVPRKIYFSHLRIVVISEQVAREGIRNTLDFFSRDHEMRSDFYIAVAKNTKVQQILTSFTAIEKLPAAKLFSSLQVSEKAWAPTVGVHLDDLLSSLVSSGKAAVLQAVELKGEKPVAKTMENIGRIYTPAYLRYTSIGVFKKDKLVGWLNGNESKGYNYIMGKVKSTVGYVPCAKGGRVTNEVIRTKTDMKGKVENGKPEIEIVVFIEENIGEVQCNIDLSKPKTIREIEKKGEKKTKELIESAIKAAQKKYKSDIFGFGEAIHRADPKLWKQLEKNWDEEFSNLAVHVKADVKVRRTGTTGNSFINQLEKNE
ncbi:spore germination protein KC [Aneurinibacillus soli]|uniref:Spore germination protein B3 n=1 Tax=Aneurinibacillus soli TaxID=1500254 RepID=A0A0U5AWV2_9BACL|nr:Ger(x)C family spore germination protein [Aneurinibacillus soli]PYE59304.1 spore germination protein KC [Aneurinibacillus soli]BAU26706.1 Spore germination protein B3 precursor [Aneurinibacillus soli]